jgi:hypothetical protein
MSDSKKNVVLRINPELRQAEATPKWTRWMVLVIFLSIWLEWLVFTWKHWERMAQTVDIFAWISLLVFAPLPCIFMFYKPGRYSPAAALSHMLC